MAILVDFPKAFLSKTFKAVVKYFSLLQFSAKLHQIGLLFKFVWLEIQSTETQYTLFTYFQIVWLLV